VTVAERRNDIDRLTVLRGDTRKSFTLPESQVHRIGDVAINDAGNRIVVSRRQYSGQPASEVIDIDLAAGTIEPHEVRCTAVAAGDDFTVIAVTGGDLVRRSRAGTATIGHHPDVTALAVAHGVVATGGADGTISLWSTAGEPLGALIGATAAIRALAFSRDATRLAGTGVDGTLVWDLRP
jgi:WD40 repeat protein